MLFVPIVRNVDQATNHAPVHELNHRVLNEDRMLVETQHAENLPLDLMTDARIEVDRASIAYRRGLPNTGLGRAHTA